MLYSDDFPARLQFVSLSLQLVGPQFIQAIKPALENQWTEEVEVAWSLLMSNIAYLMKNAMLQGK